MSFLVTDTGFLGYPSSNSSYSRKGSKTIKNTPKMACRWAIFEDTSWIHGNTHSRVNLNFIAIIRHRSKNSVMSYTEHKQSINSPIAMCVNFGLQIPLLYPKTQRKQKNVNLLPDGGNIVKFWRAVLKLAHKARYHLKHRQLDVQTEQYTDLLTALLSHRCHLLF